MAGLGWNNMHHDPSHGRKRPCPTPQIACRICDQVFTSIQALINHIESHMIEDEAMARRQHEISLLLSQRNQFLLSSTSPYQSNPIPIPSSGFMNPILSHDRNPFPVPTARPPSRVFMPRQICPPFPATARTFPLQHGFQLPPNTPQMPQYMATQETLANYNHRPFSAPRPPTANVPDVPRPRVVRDQQDHNRKTSDDTEPLDLTLRL